MRRIVSFILLRVVLQEGSRSVFLLLLFFLGRRLLLSLLHSLALAFSFALKRLYWPDDHDV